MSLNIKNLHELKEERERLEEWVSDAEVDVSLAMAQASIVPRFVVAQGNLKKAKAKHKEAMRKMTILNDKIMEMEAARGDEVGEIEMRITRKRAYPFGGFRRFTWIQWHPSNWNEVCMEYRVNESYKIGS